MVKINEEKCIGCGLCVKDCVVKNLELKDKKSTVIKQCFLCGHCVAICPKNAVSIEEYDMEEVKDFNKETFLLNPENFLNAVKFRRSVRDFKDKKIEKEVLDKIVEAGRFTETAVNYQDVRFSVVQNELPKAKELIYEGLLKATKDMKPGAKEVFMGYYNAFKENPENDRLFFNAPALMVVSCNVLLDGGLASANAEMMAVALGLGVMFDGYVVNGIKHSPEAQEFLGIGTKEIASAFILGYPGRTYRRTVPRRAADVIYK